MTRDHSKECPPHKRLELEDLLAFYTDQNDKNIQKSITSKQEFKELASSPLEKLQGKYFKHQLLVQRFLQAYDDLFLFHDTGTGKSRILDLIGEYFRKNRDKDSKVQKMLVLTKSDVLKSEVEKQIVGYCTDGTYDVDDVEATHKKRAVRKKIGEWYRIVGYQKLAKELEEMDDFSIIDTFSEHLIFFDEVHNIRIEDPDAKIHKKEVYNQIYRLFHLPHNIKRVIATATPMINGIGEIGPLFNFILPEDKQFPPDFPYETATYEDYEVYFRGRVSYVRSLDTGVNVRRVGIPVTEIPDYDHDCSFDPQIKVFPNYMSEFQNEAYMRASSGSSSSKKCKKKKTFYHGERQAANFVYPNGKWGTKAFKKFTQKLGNNYYPTPEFKKAISTIDDIRKLSVKVANIIEISNRVKDGCVYIYDNFVEASGAITIAMCFQAMGYELFNESFSLFRQSSVDDKKGKYNKSKKVLCPHFKAKPRVALFTAMTPDTVFDSMMELMNSPENKHGDYIKVFIVSPTGSEGISLNHVVSIHLSSGSWKYATTHQAENRAIRATSHTLLLEEKQEVYAEAGLDPDDARVDVDIYYHVAISRSSPAKSIDAYLYTLSEFKDRSIRKVQRFMKRAAIDSQIHYDRNVRDTDKPGTIESDYLDDKSYSKEHDYMKETDFSTYDVNYIDEAVNEIIDTVIDFFKSEYTINIHKLLEVVAERTDVIPRMKYLIFALHKLIENNVTIVDRCGIPSYLRKNGETVYIVRGVVQEHSTSSNPLSTTHYTNRIIAQSLNPLGKIKHEIVKEKHHHLAKELGEKIRNDIQLSPKDFSNIDVCSCLLEEELREYAMSNVEVEDLLNPMSKVVKRFSLHNEPKNRKPSNYYVLREPEKMIRSLKEDLAKKKQGRGRKPKFGVRKVKATHYDQTKEYDWDTCTDIMYVHNLYTLKRTQAKYADKTRYFKASGRLRVLRVGNGGGEVGMWRDMTSEEAVAYGLWIQKELHHFKSYFEERSLVHGYFLGDKSLTIRNKIDENPEAVNDKRKLKSGIVCNNITTPILIKILEYFDIEPIKKIGNDKSKTFLISSIAKTTGFHEIENEIHNYDIDRLRYFASWNLSQKVVMCRTINKALVERDLLFRTL